MGISRVFFGIFLGYFSDMHCDAAQLSTLLTEKNFSLDTEEPPGPCRLHFILELWNEEHNIHCTVREASIPIKIFLAPTGALIVIVH